MTAAVFSQNIEALHLLKHPFYQDWMAGKLSAVTLKDYASQYYHHVSAFPRYISAIHSLCEEQNDRQLLLQNLNDEEGTGFEASHPELWLRFAEGIGANRDHVRTQDMHPAVQNVINTFFKFARSSYHEGVGALFAYESQIPEIAESKIEGLRQNYGISDARTLEFFEVHRLADVAHRAVLEDILNRLPNREKEQALAASRETAQALWDFLTAVHVTNPRAVA